MILPWHRWVVTTSAHGRSVSRGFYSRRGARSFARDLRLEIVAAGHTPRVLVGPR